MGNQVKDRALKPEREKRGTGMRLGGIVDVVKKVFWDRSQICGDA